MSAQEQEEPDWERVLAHLQPKMPLYCPEEPSLTQRVFLWTSHFEALYGGAAGGGKSSALLMAALQYVDVPRYNAMLFRRTYADLALPNALMDRFLSWIALYDDIKWNSNSYTATFPSGARVSFGYLNNAQDYLRYKGAEFQFVGFDEVTEIREHDYQYLFSRLRKPKSGPLARVPLRVRAASNPAPNWVRQRFIVEGPAEGRIFVPASLHDNPGVEPDSYLRMLAELDPITRRQLEHGDWWASAEGSLFKRENFVPIERNDVPLVTSGARIVRFWDLAASEKTERNRDPDYTVGTLMLADQGRFYVLDVKRARLNSDGVENLVRSTAEQDGLLVPVRMEQEGGATGKIVHDQFARYVLNGFDFDSIPATGDKLVRARPYSAAVANGNVHVVQDAWFTDWVDEHMTFGTDTAAHDDQVDSAVGAFTYLNGLGLPQRRRASIIV